MQGVLGDPEIKLKKAKNVQCLLHNNEVQSLCHNLLSVVASLERGATERGEPMAIGWPKWLRHTSLLPVCTFCNL